MYVANPTRQNREVQFRIPERVSPIIQHVPAGGQILLVGGDMGTKDIEAAVRQLSSYGMVHVSEIDHTKQLVSLIYSLDTPVKHQKLVFGLQHNAMVLGVRGKENRDKAAIAMHSALEQQLAENRVAQISEMDVQVVEEDRPRSSGDDHELISEGRVVSRTAEPDSRPKGRKGR
jgi:hypothetical protein